MGDTHGDKSIIYVQLTLEFYLIFCFFYMWDLRVSKVKFGWEPIRPNSNQFGYFPNNSRSNQITDERFFD